jgi:hypothetical protein
VSQGSDKQCRLTAQGKLKLTKALEHSFGKGFDNSQVARELLENVNLRETVAKVRDAEEWVVKNSIERLFTPLDLDLKPEDYESKSRTLDPKSQLSAPNPFEQTDLWGCDELLRRIFERLRQGGSQALIGPAGCGKTEILRTIGQGGAVRLGREEETFLYVDMHLIRDEQGFFEELSMALDFDTCDQNQMRRKLIRARRPYVLCLDAIHVLTNEAFFPEATRNWLRGMAEMPSSPLQLVVTSQEDLRAIFPDNPNRSSPLADFFAGQTAWLEHWDVEKVGKFVNDRLSTTGVQFEPGQIEAIQQQSGGKPKLVRDLAAEIYHLMTRP